MIFAKNKTDHLIQILDAQDLLKDKPRSSRVSEINKLVGVQPNIFDEYYLPAISNFVSLVQLLPASEYHHHSHQGGLLDHVLSTVVYGLRERKKYILPINSPPEITAKLSDTYTYAVFCGALMHDLGKIVTDIEVVLFTKRGNELFGWNPFIGAMNLIKEAKFYDCKYKKNRIYSNHVCSSLLLSSVIPDVGWDWLRSTPDVIKQFLAIFDSSRSEVEKIVKTADQISTARAMGAKNKPEFTNSRPLHTLFIPTIRQLIDDGTITLNRKGSQAWVCGDSIWLMSKIVVDELRKKLHSNGHTSVPTDNSRVFDMLSEFGLVQLNNSKAIWKIKVSNDDWKPPVFTVIKMLISELYPNPDDQPEPWSGLIKEVLDSADKPVIDNISNPHSEQTSGNNITPKPTVGARALFMVDDSTEPVQRMSNTNPVQKRTSFISEIKAANKDQSVNSHQGSLSLERSKKEELGQEFLSWLKSSLKNKTISMNTSKSFIHTVPEGLGLVSPVVFKQFAATKAECDWHLAQSGFQSLRINIKHPKTEENVIKYRIEGGRKPAKISLWVVPNEIMEGVLKLPEPNDHLQIIE